MKAHASPRSERALLENALAGNDAVLCELKTSVGGLSRDQYQWEFNSKSGSIGKHSRHIIDHYTCFFSGVEAGAVNYDARKRDAVLETDPLKACDTVALITERLTTIDRFDSDASLSVVSSTDAEIEALVTASTIARELVFLQSHTIHHMASIRILFELQGVEVPGSFGLSPSTSRLEQVRG